MNIVKTGKYPVRFNFNNDNWKLTQEETIRRDGVIVKVYKIWRNVDNVWLFCGYDITSCSLSANVPATISILDQWLYRDFE